MLGKDASCRNRRRDLREFIRRFCPDLDKTRIKFFRQSLWGILGSGSLPQWARSVEIDTPLIIDLTDLPRPRGRKPPHIALVRDGSEDELHYKPPWPAQNG